MIIGEPPPTRGDLNFRLFGIPVRVHPFFWVVGFFLSIRGGQAEPVSTVIWIVALFISILIHELGHAFAARGHGWQPWVTLYGLGGLASYNPTYHSPRSQILIAAAGPAAGFAFAGLVLIAVQLSGHEILFERRLFRPFTNGRMDNLIYDLLWINILWGIVNLFPIYPLDGGQIAREVLVELNPQQGIVRSLWLSIFSGAALAIFGLTQNWLFVALMFGYLAYMSYVTLQNYQGRGGVRW